MKIAKFIKNLPAWNGDTNLYKLSPPYEQNDKITEYVVVSAVYAMYSGDETYIFAANKNGKVNNFSEMEGSFRGELNQAKALAGLGYDIEN